MNGELKERSSFVHTEDVMTKRRVRWRMNKTASATRAYKSKCDMADALRLAKALLKERKA